MLESALTERELIARFVDALRELPEVEADLAHWEPVGQHSDLHAQPLDTRQANGAQVRSFQYAIERLKGKPQLANLLIHKPGSLADEAAHLDQLADVYRRGLREVAQLIDGTEAKPS